MNDQHPRLHTLLSKGEILGLSHLLELHFATDPDVRADLVKMVSVRQRDIVAAQSRLNWILREHGWISET